MRRAGSILRLGEVHSIAAPGSGVCALNPAYPNMTVETLQIRSVFWCKFLMLRGHLIASALAAQNERAARWSKQRGVPAKAEFRAQR